MERVAEKGSLPRYPAVGIELRVAQEFEHRSVQLVGAGLGHHRDRAATETAFIGGKTVCLDPELLYGIRVGGDIAGVAQAAGVAAAVERVVDRTDAGIGGTVDDGSLHRGTEIVGGCVGGVHPCGQGEQGVDIPVHQRQVGNFGIRDHLTQGRGCCFHHRRRRLAHLDRIGNRTHFQLGVDAGIGPHLQHDAAALKSPETGGGDVELVAANRQELEGITAVRESCNLAGRVGLQIDHRHPG